MNKIYLSPPHMNGSELSFINDAFEKNWIAPIGENLFKFEEALENYLGENKKVAALSSGTAALHLALKLCDVGPGDEVFCQSFTFCASANPIVYQGATPVFIGSESKSWSICPETLEKALAEKKRKNKLPKALILVHLYGCPGDLDKILSLCREYNIKVIEDAAEALGGSYKERKLGTFGNYAILSFNGNKIITTSGGGALVVNSRKEKDKAVFYSTQARDQQPHYEHKEIGYNYRLSNISAGIGRGQLTTLDEWVSRRRNNFKSYRRSLSKLCSISFQSELENSYSNRWLSAFTNDDWCYDDVLKTIENMASEGIECRPLWKPLHIQPVFRNCEYYGSNLEEILFSKGICLPSGSSLKKEDVDFVMDTLKGSL